MSKSTFLAGLGRQLLLFLLYAFAGVVCTGIAGFIYLGVSGKPDLKPWHTATLQEEFTSANRAHVDGVAAYSALEDRLFAELQR